jgi:hypothetical protein
MNRESGSGSFGCWCRLAESVAFEIAGSCRIQDRGHDDACRTCLCRALDDLRIIANVPSLVDACPN